MYLYSIKNIPYTYITFYLILINEVIKKIKSEKNM